MKIYPNKTFKDLTSINCGGKIKTFIEINDINELKYFKDFYVIGNGTNILASSKLFEKTLIKLNLKQFIEIKDLKLTVVANMSLNNLINILANLGYYNLTRLYGIPGSIGGCIYMNSGAFNDEISNHLIEILVYDNGFKWLKKSDILFEYRKSNIKGVIIYARFNLYVGIDNRLYVKNKRLNQEKFKTFGSTFKNLKGINAYKIIDYLGFRGFILGGAKISNKHSNFIINYKESTPEDIYNLINLIILNAYSRFHLKLELEVQLLNF